MASLIFGDFNLSNDQKSKLEALTRDAPQMLGIQYFSNLDTSSNEEIPSGIAMYFPADAQVDSTLISDNMFQVFAVSKVLGAPYGKTLNDDYFSGKIAVVNSAVEQHPRMPATGLVRHPVTNKDRKAWNSELGGPGSFAGIYFQLHDDHRTKDYYYVTRGTVPLVVRDLKQRINEEGPTFRELIYGKEWKGLVDHAEYMAQRNAQKNLAQLAETCQTSINREDDIGAALVNEKDEPVLHMAKPERAVPTWQQKTYSIRTTMFKGKPAVAIYNGVVPKEDCSGDRFFVVSNPYDGLYSFPISKNLIKSVAAVPADTGRATSVAAPLGKKAIPSIVVCEGNSSKVVKEEAMQGNPLTKSIKESIKAVGWDSENHVGLLVPLVLKLYNPELKRN